MDALRSIAALALAAALLAAVLAGCVGTPQDYRSPREIPEGPGMFSGENGALAFTASRRAAPPATDEEYREFQEWREWKRHHGK